MSDLPKLLLVDDRPENLLALAGLLRRNDAEILSAESGKRALELLLEHEVALAIIDVQMPEMDGFQLAELMRDFERTREIPIMFVTAGLHDRARVFKGYESGAVDFLVKPIEQPVLASKVSVFLQLHRQRQLLALRVTELERALSERRKAEDERERSEAALRQSETRLGLLSRTAGRLLTSDAPQNVIEGLCREVMEHLDCQTFFNYLVDEVDCRLRLNACAGIPDEEVRKIQSLDFGVAVCGCVARDGQRMIAEDISISADPRVALVKSYGVQAYCCHPLIAQGKLLGTLSFGTKTRTRFTADEVEIMHSVADQVATAVERVEAQRALQAANAQLVEADRRKNEFLAVLSHELRNPLAPIKNSLYILDRAAAGGEQARRALGVIDRQATQLSNLVNDLLDVTRITRNKIRLQKQRLELNELVRRAVEDNRTLFERNEVVLSCDPSPALVFVNADATRVAQIVGNLLQNAAKFTSRGGRVRVSIVAEARDAVIRVVDNGVGMAPDTVTRLFQPFMQADHTLDRSKGGLGLGLALVRGLVELHGGSIEAKSEGLGRGAEFTVRLALDVGTALEEQAARAGNVRVPRRVLIIEDNVDAADSLREALELGEHMVEVAHSGPEGIERARSFPPDVVLCDIGLPGMDGYDVARAFRQDPELQSIFLVALSGYASPEDLERAADAGFQRHLAKPPSVDALERLLLELPGASA
ncbi:MAG: response regulator [Polyangia bacterium]|jgi:signal transduction histidine kinase/DNA-binding response OmpR family regulator